MIAVTSAAKDNKQSSFIHKKQDLPISPPY